LQEKPTKVQKLKTKPTILKLGGSVVTRKEKPLTPNLRAIKRLTNEISKANISPLVLVHGGGSFGHPLAEQYGIKEGYKDSSQIMGFSKTHQAMTKLNKLIVDSLINHNIPAVGVQPSSCIVTKAGRIQSMDEKPLKRMLEMGFVPVLYGDAVPDAKLGFTVLSGDQLVSALATKLNAQRIIVGVDVDGLFDADPKIKKTAKKLSHLSLGELKQLQGNVGKSTACDVTGGMFGKIAELLPALEKGISVTIVNATKPGRIYKALKGESIEGTLIEKE